MEKEQHKEPGYVYILTNPSFREDWVKIGKSSRPVDVRSKELDNTAVPLPFEIYATFRTVKYNEVEKLVHKYIDRFTHLRIRQNREFFNVSPKVALDIFRDIAQAIDDAVITEYNENKPEECHNKPIQDIAKRKGKREKFTINGKGEFYKNGCMVEVIRQYIKERSLTYKEIERDGFFINKKVEMLLSSDTSNATTKSVGLATIGFADAYEDLKPDMIVSPITVTGTPLKVLLVLLLTSCKNWAFSSLFHTSYLVIVKLS